ncbi:MAG TPA: hypothetical protein VHD90_27720, partial [Phototrophicaceae bacterium]|nr:hypothetical protein [Phototrophicaceae bacterium]
LALADPISASAVIVAVYFAARLSKRISYVDAALCGFALFLAYDAKISAVPYLCIPVLAIVALRRTWAGVRWAVAALITGGGLMAIYVGIVYWRGYDPLFQLKTAAGAPFSENIANNFSVTARTLIGYFGLVATLLFLVALVVLLIRRRWFVPLCLLLPLGVYWLSSRQQSRYIIAPITLLLICAAIALGAAIDHRRALYLPALALVLIGGLALWLPFASTEITMPATLPLSAEDHAEYVTAEGSGFGLPQVIDTLEQQRPTRVIGILANCLSLRELAPFPVECPALHPSGQDIPALTKLMAASRAPGTFVILEAIPYAPSSAPGRLIAAIDVGRPRLSIYDLTP